MEATKKVKDLITKAWSIIADEPFDPEPIKDTINYLKSQQFALECVNEIIDSYPTYVKTFNSSKGLHVIHEDNRDYWREVKQILTNNRD